MTLFLLPPRLSGWCLAKADTMSRWCHEAVTAEEMLRNAGGHGSKIRRKHWKEKKWHFNYTIDTRETLLERKFFFPANCTYSEKCIFLELSVSRVHFAPECSETELHIADTNLMASSVSGIRREQAEWQGVPSGDCSIQHPAIRNNPPGLSVIFGSQRWV